jgi:hypothetical protein
MLVVLEFLQMEVEVHRTFLVEVDSWALKVEVGHTK